MLNILLLLLNLTPANASLQVHPTRVIFSGGERVAQVTIEHRGDQPETYRISTMFYRMEKDGAMTPVLNPQESDRSAHKMIRFSPKRVTLEPFKEQVVRILLRNPKGIPETDLRTHLYFRPSDEAPKVDDPKEPNKTQMSLRAKVAVAIPIIIKNKKKYDYADSLKLKNLKLIKTNDNKTNFTVNIENQSDNFIHANLRLYYKKDGKTYLVSRVNGVSIYTKNRTAKYPINMPDKVKLESGELSLELKLPSSEGGGTIASTSVNL